MCLRRWLIQTVGNKQQYTASVANRLRQAARVYGSLPKSEDCSGGWAALCAAS